MSMVSHQIKHTQLNHTALGKPFVCGGGCISQGGSGSRAAAWAAKSVLTPAEVPPTHLASVEGAAFCFLGGGGAQSESVATRNS